MYRKNFVISEEELKELEKKVAEKEKDKIKYLNFAKDYKSSLLSGNKLSTIRLGKKTHLKEGDLVYINCANEILGIARVKKVEFKKLKEVTREDAKLDGFKSKKKLRNALKKHYKKVSGESDVTIIQFEWVERFKNPKVIEEENPIKIAKLALEFDKQLTHAERSLLKMLIQMGSLRKAALALGGLEKRRIFRSILRECKERLKKQGIDVDN